MARHIIHRAVFPGRQPGIQADFRGLQIHPGDPCRGKAQLARPAANLSHALVFMSFAFRMHPEQSTELVLPLADEVATGALARALGQTLVPGMVVWLRGDLGAGKTTLVRALLRYCGETGPVKSPTYTLIEVHPISGIDFYHFDFYRFSAPEEYLDAGLDDYFAGQGICLVEWPDNALPYLSEPDLAIDLRHGAHDEARSAHLRAFTERGAVCLTAAASLALPPAR